MLVSGFAYMMVCNGYAA